jgi:hypothetical protein
MIRWSSPTRYPCIEPASDAQRGRGYAGKMPRGGDSKVSREGKALNWEDSERLKQFEKRLQRRPGLREHS